MKVTCPRCKRRIRLKKSRNMLCKCGYEFRYTEYFGNKKIYLVDANVIIYAMEKKNITGKICKKVLSRSDIATTERVLKEVQCEINISLKVFRVKKISDELKELKANTLKQPSEADLSLIQAAMDHPEINGIITYDRDFKNIATSGIIQTKSSKYSAKFWVGNAKEFLDKHRSEV